MNALELLNAYLARFERRLRMSAISRGAAITAAVALGITVALVVIANRYAFSDASVLWARILLFLSLAIAAAFGLVIPLLNVNRRRTARRVEEVVPEFKQRLLTIAERSKDRPGDPFLALLASDTADVAHRANASRVAPARSLLAYVLSACGAAGVLLWLILAGPGYMGYGASLLWAGTSNNGSEAFYDIVVTPGNTTVRRHADQMITARLVGFQSPNVHLRAKFDNSLQWDDVAMQPQPSGAGYEFVLAAVPMGAEYYVQSGVVASQHFRLNVVDLPTIRKIRVTYHYPAWTGMKDAVEDPGGDLRAVEGTKAEVSIQTDRPMKNGAIVLDDGTQIALNGEGTSFTAEVPIEKDGMYHFGAADHSQMVRLSDDYFIEARKDNPPMVQMTRPGHDEKVNPIEEVTVDVSGQDDFGLHELALHYSVNGGPEQTVDLLKQKGAKQADGKTTLALENFKLVPGDIVSLYATARDDRTTAKTDMFFIQAQPFEMNYSQSQQMGGGGAQNDQQSEISERQKEIVAATWNEMKGQGSRNAQEAAANAQFLAGVQSKLRDQARSLSERAKSRELASTSQQFQSFIKDMDAAVAAMGEAAGKLKANNFKGALPPEQKALQNALRAESTFRDIQVAFGAQGGNGMSGAARDLDNLFDLELDTEKNQYETGQQAMSSGERQRQIDEALEKLKELAKRQQELAQQQRQQQQQFQQRWQQEQLRREAEQLQQQLEQLSRGSQSATNQGASANPQSGQSGQMDSQRGMSRLQSASNQRLQETLDRLKRATEDMRRAADNGDQSQAGARRAAEQLQEAQQTLSSLRRDQASAQIGDLAQRADQLFRQQQDMQNRMRRDYTSDAGPSDQEAEQMADQKDKMAQDLAALERDTQNAARSTAGSQPGLSSKLRDALGNVQEDEVQRRLQMSAEWVRQGRGAYAVTSEAMSTLALGKLRDQLKDAQGLAEKGAENGQQQANSDVEKALERVERLREQLQRAAGQQPGRNGSQSAQNGGGMSGNQGGASMGAGSSGGGRWRDPGNVQRSATAPARGGGDTAPTSPAEMERMIRETMRELSDLRRNFGPETDMGRQVGALMRELDPSAFPLAGPELQARLQRVVLPSMEELELQLRQKANNQNGEVRNSAGDPVPPGYADRVADYFRRLSGGK
jgi:hypothetical protein